MEQAYTLAGRDGVFAAVSDWVYVPRGSRLELSDVTGEVAILTQFPKDHLPVLRGKRDGFGTMLIACGVMECS